MTCRCKDNKGNDPFYCTGTHCLGAQVEGLLVLESMATRKRERNLDEFEVSEAKVSKSAKVHGMVTWLSPMKSNVSRTTKY